MLTALCTALPARLGLMIMATRGAGDGWHRSTHVGLLLSYGSVLPTPDQVQNLIGLPPIVVQFGMGAGWSSLWRNLDCDRRRSAALPRA
jgi:simple sugar transport system permease protein